MAEQPQPSADGSHDAWRAYWKAVGMPWRTEPEIDEKRREFLEQRRAVQPDFERGIYPFRDEHGSIKLSRADVEWLLATHSDGGVHGPIDVNAPSHLWREGLDLRGADLRDVQLSDLPLARMRGGATSDQWWFSGFAQGRELAAVHLEGAWLSRIHLEQAALRGAHLENADLGEAHFEGTICLATHFEGANLRQAKFDIETLLDRAILSDRQHVGAWLADTRWNGVNLTAIDWSQLHIVADERQARDKYAPYFLILDPDSGEAMRAFEATLKGRPATSEHVRRVLKAMPRKDISARRLEAYQSSVRAYRQIARALTAQGNGEDADRFAYRAQLCQRIVLRKQRKFVRWLFSCLLDLISGYGYKPMRSVITYVVTICVFAGAYLLSARVGQLHLTWDESLVLSISSFHGRGFLNSSISLGDTIARIAAGEAIVGLLIEITFIATFTNRFFAR